MRLARVNVLKQSENSQRRRTNSAEHRGKQNSIPIKKIEKKENQTPTQVRSPGRTGSINIPPKSRGRDEYRSPIGSPPAVQSSPMKIRGGFQREVGVGSLTDSFGKQKQIIIINY